MAVKEKEKSTDVKGLLEKIAENEKYRKAILILGILGIALIFFSGFFKGGDSAGASNTVQVPQESSEEYAGRLETKLADIIQGISGAGQTSVMVTLENGTQYIYAKEEKKSTQSTQDQTADATTRSQQNDSSETKYILVKDADGTQKALAVTEVQPTVKGVVVVCEGGGNPAVQQNVIDAVTTALNISSARVCVIKSD